MRIENNITKNINSVTNEEIIRKGNIIPPYHNLHSYQYEFPKIKPLTNTIPESYSCSTFKRRTLNLPIYKKPNLPGMIRLYGNFFFINCKNNDMISNTILVFQF